MLSPSLLEALDALARRIRKNDAPMGGIQVVFSGDFFQLPPVEKSKAFGAVVGGGEGGGGGGGGGGEAEEGFSQTQGAAHSQAHEQTQAQAQAQTHTSQRRFCFQSPAWRQLISKTFTLETVFRQSEAQFIAILNEVRWGGLSDKSSSILSSCIGRRFDSRDGILATRIYTHKKDVDTLNCRELAALGGVAHEYRSSDSGGLGYLANCPAREALSLKIGAQVILVKTIDASIGLVNGARGVVVKFSNDTKRPTVGFVSSINNEYVERMLTAETFTITMGGKVVAQRKQLPLDLAWGISVHKVKYRHSKNT